MSPMSIPNDPLPAADYTPAALAACELALRTLLKKLGTWGPHVVLVGGLAPRYLVPEPPPGIRAHLGTTDLDLVLGICLPEDDVQLYRTLEDSLRAAKFEQAPDKAGTGKLTWRWQRQVNDAVVCLEFFCPSNDGEPGRPERNPHLETGDVSALRMRGAELAGMDYIVKDLAGDTLDNGGIVTVSVRVANLLPLLALKAFALVGRDKDKDAYDIVWTLNAWGAEALRVDRQAARSVGAGGGDFCAQVASPWRTTAVGKEDVALGCSHPRVYIIPPSPISSLPPGGVFASIERLHLTPRLGGLEARLVERLGQPLPQWLSPPHREK